MNVYFIASRVGNRRLMKIGKAKDVERRMQQLQVGFPYPLFLLAHIACRSDQQAVRVERAAHEFFEKYRIRSNGEWFRLTESAEREAIYFAEVSGSSMVRELPL